MENKFRILFFDTETTGLPINYKAPLDDFNNWPRLVQIAWIVTDSQGVIIRERDLIIKPEGFEIPEQSTNIHGITTETANKKGSRLPDVLSEFNSELENCIIMVGHNISFDRSVVGCEFLRNNMIDTMHGKDRICTMFKSVKFCNLPGKYGPKWPKLSELHQVLFGTGFDDGHNAFADIQATVSCFFELIKQGVISFNEEAI